MNKLDQFTDISMKRIVEHTNHFLCFHQQTLSIPDVQTLKLAKQLVKSNIVKSNINK